jgi:hypothetical protein
MAGGFDTSNIDRRLAEMESRHKRMDALVMPDGTIASHDPDMQQRAEQLAGLIKALKRERDQRKAGIWEEPTPAEDNKPVPSASVAALPLPAKPWNKDPDLEALLREFPAEQHEFVRDNVAEDTHVNSSIRDLDERFDKLKNIDRPVHYTCRMNLLLWSVITSAIKIARDKSREIDALEKRIGVLEQRPTLKYSGVFDSDREYLCGEFVSFQGSLWHANLTTKGATPGTSPLSWQLAVKHGRDAREKR